MNRDLVDGARVEWIVAGRPAGQGTTVAGKAALEVADHKAIVSVKATWRGHSVGPIGLGRSRTSYDLRLDVPARRWRDFPGTLGMAALLLTVVLRGVFDPPTQAQSRVMFATFALGVGAWTGLFVGFRKPAPVARVVVIALVSAAIFAALYWGLGVGG